MTPQIRPMTPEVRPRTPQIRPMTAEDIPAVARLMAGSETWQRYGIDASQAASTLAGFVERASRDSADCACLVAEQDLQVVGFVVLLLYGCFGMSGYIKLIGTREDRRRMGVGRLLLSAAEALAFARGPNVFLLVSHFNDPAIRFYERMGYQRIGVIEDYVVPGIDEIFYRKSVGATHPEESVGAIRPDSGRELLPV
jgi:ribosomal protein S18 acetylase RimI-like enzyme